MRIFNPKLKSESEISRYYNYFGTFYNSMLDNNSKELLKKYLQAFLTSLEGIYYNLYEATGILSFGISDFNFIDLSYNKIIINSNYYKIIKLKNVTNFRATVTSVNNNDTTYKYAITAVDKYGNESFIEYTQIKAPAILDNDNYVVLSWNSVNYAYSYNIYKYNNGFKLLDNVNVLSLSDKGQNLLDINETIPTENNSIAYLLYNIPFNFDFIYIGKLNDLQYGVDFILEDTRTLKLINLDAFYNKNNEYILYYAYAIIPFLKKYYFNFLLNDNVNEILMYNYYDSYLSNDNIKLIYTEYEQFIKLWIYGINKFFHKLEILLKKINTISNLKEIISLIYNVPFAYNEGIVKSITDKTTYNEVIIDNVIYNIPIKFKLTVDVGDNIKKYQFLAKMIDIRDAYSQTPVVISNDFDENKFIEIDIPKDYETNNYSKLLKDLFFKKILPSNLIYTINYI